MQLALEGFSLLALTVASASIIRAKLHSQLSQMIESYIKRKYNLSASRNSNIKYMPRKNELYIHLLTSLALGVTVVIFLSFPSQQIAGALTGAVAVIFLFLQGNEVQANFRKELLRHDALFSVSKDRTRRNA